MSASIQSCIVPCFLVAHFHFLWESSLWLLTLPNHSFIHPPYQTRLMQSSWADKELITLFYSASSETIKFTCFWYQLHNLFFLQRHIHIITVTQDVERGNYGEKQTKNKQTNKIKSKRTGKLAKGMVFHSKNTGVKVMWDFSLSQHPLSCLCYFNTSVFAVN